MPEPEDEKSPNDLLDWLGISASPNWARSRSLGGIIGSLLTLVIPLLFVGAIGAAFAVLWHTVQSAFSPNSQGVSLGAGSLIAALLGAPFLIWGTVLKHRTTRIQQEGHMTDRIAKAVEMLGAEKVMSYPARTVTFRNGGAVTRRVPEYLNHTTEAEISPEEGKEDGVEYGDWAVFNETEPNLEVRIGGILSLERIAQDSTKFDKGRDHVRVMEILCAYVRENAPARDANNEDPRNDSYKELSRLRRNRPFDERIDLYSDIVGSGLVSVTLDAKSEWARKVKRPRIDIQTALDVIGRRSDAQKAVEFGLETSAYLELKKRNTSAIDFSKRTSGMKALELRRMLEKMTCGDNMPNYRLNLSAVNLQGAKLDDGDFSWADLNSCRFDLASMKNSDFSNCSLEWSSFVDTNMSNTTLFLANLSMSSIIDSTAFNTVFVGSGLQMAIIHGGVFSGSNFSASFASACGFSFINLSNVFFNGSYANNMRIVGCGGRGVLFRGMAFDEFSQFEHNNFSCARMRDVDLRKAHVGANQFDKQWGDESVQLPKSVSKPTHWPQWVLPELGLNNFDEEYECWQREGDAYTPPPPPTSRT